jgi:hypothetical protein
MIDDSATDPARSDPRHRCDPPCRDGFHIRTGAHFVFDSGEPYFGQSGANRFDAPGCLTGTPQYQCCYLGLSFDVALAESLLHDEVARRGKFRIAQSEIDRRWVHRFSGTFNLIDLTGSLLKRVGGHAGLTGSSNYKLTQRWALAAHTNPQVVDGFFYMSRHMTGHKALVLFDRAKGKLHPTGKPTPLVMSPEMPAAMAAFGIAPY